MSNVNETTAPKVILFIAMLFMLVETVLYSESGGIGILYGILEIIFIILIFLSLAFVRTKPVEIPYYWWIYLILGIILILFSFLQEVFLQFFTGFLLILAVIVELLCENKEFKASKLVLLIGIILSLYDSVLCLFAGDAGIGPGIIGLILVIILLILVLDLFDIKIPMEWWTVLAIAFVIFTWVSPLVTGYIFGGFGGYILMIAWVLLIFAF
ncbi:MAG: hypothetical protein ACFFCE_19195 [Promethearchaeota archaeon]